ncbi:uncharacterized protein N7515_006515 [Penicillium bovifimosum]|uniref:Uncharacterized protein n=1 Tax=Penicillium bovifimosum TaxID=126998 RepID=A0A9W9L0T9_9EURO|nr:uncharacterized protein N7515_006515 [Penicillium bovifimosum]KAJ5130476.1 hypothetical protein N7515_006515 [Penicillium bovifimosum]
MIRRAPTIIVLDQNDVDSHLERIYLRDSLTTSFEQLRLNENEGFDLLAHLPMSSGVSSDPSEDIEESGLGQGGCSRYEDASSSKYKSCASIDGNPPTSVIKSCLRSPDMRQQQSSSSQNAVSSEVYPCRPDRFVDPARLKVKFALSSQAFQHKGSSHSPEGETDPRGNNDQAGHIDAIGPPPVAIDSSSSTPQISFLSCAVSSSPSTAKLPLPLPHRDLTLAPATDEAMVAERTVSPASIGGDRGSHAKLVTELD